MTTKRAVVLQAFRQAGVASYVFDLRPEELRDVVIELDQMLALWASRGINLGYNAGGDGDLDTDSGLAMADLSAVSQNLALTVCSMFGRQVPPTLMESAAQSYAGLLTKALMNVDASRANQGGLPYGAGNRGRGFPAEVFIPADSTAPIGQRGDNGNLVLGE